MSKKRHFKDRLKRGESVIGTWVTIPSSVTLDVISSTGLDFVVLDSEHGPLGHEKIQELIVVAESRGVAPMVRVPGIQESDILKALDMGAYGVQVPNVNSIEHCRSIVDYSKYPPLGSRGFSPFTRSGAYGGEDRISLTKMANDETLIVINVEGKEAIDNIDHILDIEELDVVFIGLFDLSKALGVPGDIENPLVQEAMNVLVSKIKAKNKIAGTIVTSPEALNKFMALGVQYLVYLVDADIIRSSYQAIVRNFRLEKMNG